MLKSFHLIKVDADNFGLGLSCLALHTCFAALVLKGKTSLKQILTTAEHSWAESL